MRLDEGAAEAVLTQASEDLALAAELEAAVRAALERARFMKTRAGAPVEALCPEDVETIRGVLKRITCR